MRLIAAVMLSCILCGCASGNSAFDRAVRLREALLAANTCSFDASVTAHYTDTAYQFQLSCAVDHNGALTFTVSSPETIQGISGKISSDTAALTFDDKVLVFPILADDRLTPVSAPWIFYSTLLSGYLTGCMESEDGLVISIDDSFLENPLHLQIHTGRNDIPVYAEVYYQENMVISLGISSFTLV